MKRLTILFGLLLLATTADALTSISVRKVYGREVYTIADKTADDQFFVDAINAGYAYFPGTDSLKITYVVTDYLKGKAGKLVQLATTETLKVPHSRLTEATLDSLKGIAGTATAPIQDTLRIHNLKLAFTGGGSWSSDMWGIDSAQATAAKIQRLRLDTLKTGAVVQGTAAFQGPVTSVLSPNFTAGFTAAHATIGILTTTGQSTFGNAPTDTTHARGSLVVGTGTVQPGNVNKSHIQLGPSTGIWADSVAADGSNFFIGNNIYFDGAWKRVVAGDQCTRLYTGDGVWHLQYAGGGAANATVTFADVFGLDSLGTATFAGNLSIAGTKVLPALDNTTTLGSTSVSFDSLYLHHAAAVGDIPFLDAEDDVAAICAIQGSGKYDERGRELVDDNTLPKSIMLVHMTDGVDTLVAAGDTILVPHKAGDLIIGGSGKPFYDITAAIGQLQGAIRQLKRDTQDESFGGVPIAQVVAGLVATVAGILVWNTKQKKQINTLEARIAKLEGKAPEPPNPDA